MTNPIQFTAFYNLQPTKPSLKTNESVADFVTDDLLD